jgi:hypothetical protein
MFPNNSILPGDHIRVSRGTYYHHGIYVGDLQVVHFTGAARRLQDATIRLDTLHAFAAGGSVQVVKYARCYNAESVVQELRAHRSRPDARGLTSTPRTPRRTRIIAAVDSPSSPSPSSAASSRRAPRPSRAALRAPRERLLHLVQIQAPGRAAGVVGDARHARRARRARRGHRGRPRAQAGRDRALRSSLAVGAKIEPFPGTNWQ